MSTRVVYDNWGKLVEAVLEREELRRIALCESLSSSISSDFTSRFSFDSDLYSGSSRQSNFSCRDLQPVQFKEIIKATKNFRRDMFIGAGVFCYVFKAWVDEQTLTASEPGSGMAVTVKKWNPMGQGRHQDWVKEINHLNKVHHPNLVELVGYCLEEENMILVYEFMCNGSLSDYLFTTEHHSLSWARRIKVATDAARALSYLHNMEVPVIHRDFKTANILLNEEFNAKLSNYCYGRDDPTGHLTHVSTDQVVVTYGFIAPEYAETGQLTTKFNVYSFGVVLLELLSGLRAFDINRPRKKRNLADHAKPYLGSKRKLLRIMDSRLKGQYSDDAAYKVAKLASQCVSLDPKLRPTMAEVVVTLEQL